MVLIDDTPTTFAMTHRAIEGDALVAAPQQFGFAKNFMKNSIFTASCILQSIIATAVQELNT